MTVQNALANAKLLARMAKDAGADAVKYQTHVFEDEQYKRSEARYEWIKLNESLTPLEEFWKPLKAFCDEIGVLFMTTPMSRLAAEKINELVTIWKVGSADITDMDTLHYLCHTKKPIIISSGMSTEGQVDAAVAYLKEAGADFALMHCVSIYPCPSHLLNLNTIAYFEKKYGVQVGFSDHSKSLEAPALAVKAGATIIEKHFTLDQDAYGPDQKMSISVLELEEVVKNVRRAELNLYAWGVVGKTLLEDEKKYWKNFRPNQQL